MILIGDKEITANLHVPSDGVVINRNSSSVTADVDSFVSDFTVYTGNGTVTAQPKWSNTTGKPITERVTLKYGNATGILILTQYAQ